MLRSGRENSGAKHLEIGKILKTTKFGILNDSCESQCVIHTFDPVCWKFAQAFQPIFVLNDSQKTVDDLKDSKIDDVI